MWFLLKSYDIAPDTLRAVVNVPVHVGFGLRAERSGIG